MLSECKQRWSKGIPLFNAFGLRNFSADAGIVPPGEDGGLAVKCSHIGDKCRRRVVHSLEDFGAGDAVVR